MKRILFFFTLLVCFSSCRDLGKDLNDGTAKTQVRLRVDYPKDYALDPNETLTLTVVNRHTNDTLTYYTYQDDLLNIELEQGIYNVELRNEINSNDKTYNARKDNVVVGKEDFSLRLKLMNAFFSKDWLISEMHFTANQTLHGLPYFQDGYIELYNNSTERVYADGLCLSRTYMLTNEDYNIWSKYKDVSVPFFIVQVPGKGRDYPVEAGGKLLLAVSAINHNRENEASMYDLSAADFEMYSDNSLSGIDNPSVENMNIVYIETEYTPMLFSPCEAYFIFKPTEGRSLEEYLKGKEVKERENNGEFVHSYGIPNRDIIDAVHVGEREAKINQMLFPAYLDAGFTYCTVGKYNYVSKRKVARKEGKRLVLQDTNNSTDDFLPNQESSYLIKSKK